MKELLVLVKEFEKRNNISISITFHSDESGSIKEFWDEDSLYGFNDMEELEKYLKVINYKLDENGLSYSPVQVINPEALTS